MLKNSVHVIRYLHYNLDKLNNPDNGDKAPISKGYESTVRDVVLYGKLSAKDAKARHLGKRDVTFYAVDENGEKKLIRVEVKCGCGAMFYATADGMGDFIDMPEKPEEVTEDMILSGADYVVFMLESDPRLLKNPEMVLESYVLPRADYIRMLYAMNSKPGKMHIKLCKERGQVNMQALVVYDKKHDRYNDKPLQRGYAFLDECEHVETLESFLARHGRKIVRIDE